MSTRPRSDFSFARGVLTNGVTMVIVLYVILYAVYSHIEAGALSVSAFSDLVNNTIPLAIAAAGATFVILLGGFDLSVAGVLSLVNVVLATHPLDGASGALMSLLIAVGIGAAVGLCNGILVAYGGLQSIAVTLAMMILTRGLALVVLDAPGGGVSDWISDAHQQSMGRGPCVGSCSNRRCTTVGGVPSHRHRRRAVCGR